MNIRLVKLTIVNFLLKVINSINLKRHGIEIPNDIRINGILRVSKKREQGKIVFGRNIVINSSWKANPSGGGQIRTLFSVGKNGILKIGNNCGISNSSIVCQGSVTIEDNVDIGVNSVIYDTDMHSVDYIYRKERPDTHIKVKAVTIKEGAWIGGHSIILKGVTIGRHSVVAAGSVVTKNIPDNELWGGNPARYIRGLKNDLSIDEEYSQNNVDKK